MPMFLVELHRSGPQSDPSLPLEQQSEFGAHATFMDALVDDGFIVLGGPLADEFRVIEAIEADSSAARVGHALDDPARWPGALCVMTPIAPLASAARFSWTRLVVGAVCVVVVAVLAVTIYASFHAGNSYQSFRRSCLASTGNSVIIVSEVAHASYMGGAQHEYTMGCKKSDGTVISTAKTSKP